ncbi:MAG: hypothetical protein OEZ34_13410, partial [Spirochaetia bacterium]|nr:hypothetical protein [Spirochaetia bacterium]
MKGLSLSEGGRHEEAVSAYNFAREILHKKFDPPEKQISEPGLLNYISLSYQKMDDPVRSNAFATDAEETSLKKGLRRNDEKYQPQTLAGRLLGFLIGYGEDFSVIGDGRTPYGLSSLRHHELAMGIKLDNMLLRGNFREAEALIKKRHDVFSGKDSDVILGKLGIISSLHNHAIILYRRGEYRQASEEFLKAASKANQYGLHDKYILNMQNYFYSLFSYFEDNNTNSADSEKLMKNAFRYFKELQSDYFKKAKQEYEEQKKIEDPDFSYSKKRDNPVVKNIISRKFSTLPGIEATLHFYEGLLKDRNALGSDDIFVSREHLKYSVELYKKSADLMSAKFKLTHPYIHNQLNHAHALYLYGNIPGAIEIYTEAAEKSYEFNILSDYWRARYGLFMIARSLHGSSLHSVYRKHQINPGMIIHELNSMLEQNPEIVSHLGRLPETFFKDAAEHMIRSGNHQSALLYLQKADSWVMRQAILQFPLRLNTQRETDLFNKIRDHYSEMNQLHKKEILLGIKRKNFSEIIKTKNILYKNYKTGIYDLSKRNLLINKYFSRHTKPAHPKLWKEDVLIRFFMHGGRLSCWTFSQGRLTFKTNDTSHSDHEIRSFVKQCLSNQKMNTLFLIVDENFYRYPLDSWLREDFHDKIKSISFSNSEKDIHSGFIRNPAQLTDSVKKLNLFYSKEIQKYFFLFSKNNSISIDAFPKNAPFSITAENDNLSRQMFLRSREIPIIYLKKHSGISYSQLALTYEILRMSGTGSLVVHQESESAVHAFLMGKKDGEPLDSGSYRIFGSTGFDPDPLQPYFVKRSREEFLMGKAFQEKGDLKNAMAHYLKSESFLSRIKSDKQLSAKASAGIAEINFSEGKINEAIDRYEALLQTNQPRHIYLAYIRQLFKNGMIDKAIQIKIRMNEIFPAQRASSNKELFTDELTARLKNNSFKDQKAFEKEIEKIKLYKINESEKLQIAGELQKVGFARFAENVAGARIKKDVRRDQSLASFALLPDYLEKKSSGNRMELRDIMFFDSNLDGISVILEDFFTRKYYTTENLNAVITESYLKQQTLPARTALYRMFLESASVLTEPESMDALLRIIETEKNITGTRRSAILYLNASYYFLYSYHYEKSLQFFYRYLSLRKNTFLVNDYNIYENRIGLILELTGMLNKNNPLPELVF